MRKVQRVNMDGTQSWPNDCICYQSKFVLGRFEQRTHQMYFSTEKLTAEKEDLISQGLSRLHIHSYTRPFLFTYKVAVFLNQKVELADGWPQQRNLFSTFRKLEVANFAQKKTDIL